MVQWSSMLGTVINTVAIVGGGIVGMTVARDLSVAHQARLKAFLGAFVVYAGLSTTWGALHGSFGDVVRQIVIMLLALVLGNVVGKGLRLQKGMNVLGRYARERFNQASSPAPESGSRWSEGFLTCTVLFCVGPMALLGALQDGLSGSVRTLAIKSVLDGLTAMALARSFGWGVTLAAVPVLAYQGTITLLAHAAQPLLEQRDLVASIDGTGGLLVTCLSLVVLEIKKVPLADYLPSLVIAPLLTWIWR